MGDFGLKLYSGWAIQQLWLYLFFVAIGGVAVRFVLAALWAFEQRTTRWAIPKERRRFWRLLWVRVWPWSEPRTDADSDYLHPFVLGLLELLVAPVFIFVGAWLPIGGWLTLKTVAQWDTWKTSRHTFNRFLIGNALILLGAYVLARLFVDDVPLRWPSSK